MSKNVDGLKSSEIAQLIGKAIDARQQQQTYQ